MQKLSIKRYGRFRNVDFLFSTVTVFFGGNESGKTTIFDALFEQICRNDSKRSAVWRRLTQRYGDPSLRQADADIAVPYDSGEEYLSLFAVRSSDLSLEGGKGNEAWAAAAGRSLFMQGLDMPKMAANLRKTATPHPMSNDAKKFAMLESELKRAEAELALKLKLEQEAVGQKKEIDVLEGEFNMLDENSSALGDKLSAINSKIDSLKSQRSIARSISSRGMLAEYASKKKFCDSNVLVSAEGIAEYDRLVRERDAAEKEFNAANEEIHQRELRLAEIEKLLPEQEKKRKDAELLEGASSLFNEQVQKIFELRKEHDKFNETPAIMYIVPFAIAVAGIVAAITFSAKTMAAWILLPAGIILAWLFQTNFIKRRDRASEKAEENQILSEIVNSWGERFDRSLIENVPAEHLLAKFAEFKTAAEKERSQHEAMLEEREKVRMSITDANAAITGVQIGFTTRRESAASWLLEKGFADRDSYLRAVEQKKAAEQYLKENAPKVEAMMAEESCDSVEALLALLDSRIKLMSHEGNSETNEAAIEKEISSLEREAQSVMAAIRENEEKMRIKAVDKARSDADFENKCSSIPSEIAALRNRIASLQEQIEGEKNRRDAAAMAADVLSSMDGETSIKFNELAQKASSYIGGIIPASVNIDSLSVDGLKMQDAGGQYRPVDMLSSGTRDCLMLGMRLCLAAESFGNRDKIMLFDDPFLNFDDSRTVKAVEILRRFQAANGCQLVFFTKDIRLAQLLERDWRVKAYRLAPAR